MRKKRPLFIGIMTFFLLLAVFFLPMQTVWAEDGATETLLDDDYYIDTYHVDIEVGEDNTFHITETLTYNFVQAHHGMTRVIPLWHTRNREDGSESKIYAKVSNVKCSDPIASTERDSKNYTIQVGSADAYVHGEKTYTLSYDYAMGKDPLRKVDELYFNIVGTEWECPIANISWEIHMPKAFDATSLGYSVGNYAASGYDTDMLQSTVTDQTITGSYAGNLNAYEGITVRCTLPEGYFIYKINYMPYVLVALVVLLCAILFWFTGKEDKVIPVISFEPPEGYNPLDVAFVEKEAVSNTDMAALLIYLANKGYLRIEQNKGKDSFSMTKIKDYDGDNNIEALYMKGLFRRGNTASTKSLAKDSFYEDVDKCITKENKKMKEKKFFFPTAMPKFLYFIGICVVAGVYGILARSMPMTIAFAALCFVLGGLLSPVVKEGLSNLDHKITPVVCVIIFVIAAVIFNAFAPKTWIAFVVCGIADTILALFMFFGSKRTKAGNQVYGQILGFKEFIKKAELDRLKMLVEENPSYYYDVMPYAYVLGLSEQWIENFETMHMPEPDWYSGRDPFGDAVFYSMVRSANACATAPETSGGGSSGGGFSGGGFSGGGSGGGGGGAW